MNTIHIDNASKAGNNSKIAQGQNEQKEAETGWINLPYILKMIKMHTIGIIPSKSFLKKTHTSFCDNISRFQEKITSLITVFFTRRDIELEKPFPEPAPLNAKSTSKSKKKTKADLVDYISQFTKGASSAVQKSNSSLLKKISESPSLQEKVRQVAANALLEQNLYKNDSIEKAILALKANGGMMTEEWIEELSQIEKIEKEQILIVEREIHQKLDSFFYTIGENAKNKVEIDSKSVEKSLLFFNFSTGKAEQNGSPQIASTLEQLEKEELSQPFPELSKKELLANKIQETIHSVEQLAQAALKEEFNKFIDHLKSSQIFSSNELIDIENLCKEEIEKVQYRIGAERAEMIHNREEWNSEKSFDYNYTIQSTSTSTSKIDNKHTFISSFRAAGPAYSSTMPRNRTEEISHTANFFYTSVSSKLENGSDTILPKCTSSRSAIPVEFSQLNVEERRSCTMKHIKEIIHANAYKQIKVQLEECGNSEQQEIVEGKKAIVVTQVLNTLLTPDIGRKLASYTGHVQLPDNERELLNEMLEAIEHLQGKEDTIEIDNPQGAGESIKIKIKYNILQINTPVNKLHDKYENSLVGKPFIHHRESEKINSQTITTLTNQAEKEIEKNKKKISSSLELFVSKQNKTKIEYLQKRIDNYIALRKMISKNIRNKRSIQKLQQQLNALHAGIVDDFFLHETSSESKEVCKILFKNMTISDLVADIQDLSSKNIIKRSNAMRFFLPARIIMLSSLLGYGSHFCCRSGKDRTGLVDDEIKLLYGETVANRGLINIFATENKKIGLKNRKNVIKEAGNSTFNTKANLGGLSWWAIGGCRMNFGTSKEAIAIHKKYNKAQLGSSFFQRPKIDKQHIPTANQTAINTQMVWQFL